MNITCVDHTSSSSLPVVQGRIQGMKIMSWRRIPWRITKLYGVVCEGEVSETRRQIIDG